MKLLRVLDHSIKNRPTEGQILSIDWLKNVFLIDRFLITFVIVFQNGALSAKFPSLRAQNFAILHPQIVGRQVKGYEPNNGGNNE